MKRDLTHLDPDGRPRMVDVSDKATTRRKAIAEGRIRMDSETFAALRDGKGPKGDALQVAQLAGIMGGKRTGELIPLCHVLPDASIEMDVALDESVPGVTVRATATIEGRTGVEMEALTAVSVALLTIYDMTKALDRGMSIGGIRLLSKKGGKSGSWAAGDADSDR